jgi:hypothetical protein
MMVLNKAQEANTENGSDPLESPSKAVARARSLMKRAVEKSFQIPSDVVAAVTDAHHSVGRDGGFADAELETRFWNAYGLLSSIGPVEVARRRYKAWFYVLLTMLLIFQLYYLAGSLISKRLTDIEAEWQRPAAAPAATSGGDAARTDAANPGDAWTQLRRRATSKANYVLGTSLMPWFKEFPEPKPSADNPASAMPMPRLFPPSIELEARNYMKMKGELEVVLCSLSGYILPLLYGALGAFAFILRKLSDPVGKLTYAYDTRVSYTLRVHIGALGGLAVGWFINGNAPLSGLGGSASSGLIALSPLALAFAAGYASDLLFTALDKVVAAFSPLSSQQASVKTETTYGGMTVTTEMQREARVAGGAAAAPATPEAEAAPGAEPPKVVEPRPKAA